MTLGITGPGSFVMNTNLSKKYMCYGVKFLVKMYQYFVRLQVQVCSHN